MSPSPRPLRRSSSSSSSPDRQLALDDLLAEQLVVRDGELAVVVRAVDALLELLRPGVARRGPVGHRAQVDAELLGGPQQLVLLLADGDVAAVDSRRP